MTRVGIGMYPPCEPRDWMKACSPEEVDMLTRMSDRLGAALALMPPAEAGSDEETDYRSLWVGLLLGSNSCHSFDSALAWASYARYHTTGLLT